MPKRIRHNDAGWFLRLFLSIAVYVIFRAVCVKVKTKGHFFVHVVKSIFVRVTLRSELLGYRFYLLLSFALNYEM